MDFPGGTFEASGHVVLVQRRPTFNKAHGVFFWPPMNPIDACFLTGDNTCYCFMPLLSLAGAEKAAYLFLFHFQSGAAAAVRRLVQDNSRKQGVCSPSPGYTPKYWLAVGSAPGVILRFTSQWLANCRPAEKVWMKCRDGNFPALNSWTWSWPV